jgi:hypothetical protein
MLEYTRDEAAFFRDFQANFRFMANVGYCTPVRYDPAGQVACFDPTKQLVSVKPCRPDDAGRVGVEDWLQLCLAVV